MKFVLRHTEWEEHPVEIVEIDTMEQLLALSKEKGHDLVIRRRGRGRYDVLHDPHEGMPEIEIYDGWHD